MLSFIFSVVDLFVYAGIAYVLVQKIIEPSPVEWRSKIREKQELQIIAGVFIWAFVTFFFRTLFSFF